MDSSSKNIKENKEMESREVNPEHHHHPDHPDHFSISEIPREIIHGIQKVVKGLDPNRYATKKTIAQGMLDFALLTANASQLKYFLTDGKEEQFFTLMVTLIIVSLVLQVLQAVLYIMLGTCYDLNKENHQKGANLWNNILLALNLVTVSVNVIINIFEMSTSTGKPSSSSLS